VNSIKVLECKNQTEWDAARHFRQKYFFAPHNIEDPYTWTFNHPFHQHLVLYEGLEIIGYAHIQLWKDLRAAMRIIVVDEARRNNNFGSEFLHFCEERLKTQGYKTIHAESRRTSLAFYRKNGYI